MINLFIILVASDFCSSSGITPRGEGGLTDQNIENVMADLGGAFNDTVAENVHEVESILKPLV